MRIHECNTDKDILGTHFVMQQLRPELADPILYLNLIKNLQLNEQFRLIALFENETCIGAAGFRVQSTLFRTGKAELYVNDLIVDINYRGKGYGAALIKWLKQEAHQIPYCAGLTLDSGNQRVNAHAFYQREGFGQTALHFYWPKTPEPPSDSIKDISSL